MSKLREAARRALTALNIWHGAVTDTDWKMDFQPEIDALRAALAEDRLGEGERCPCTRCDFSCEDRRKGEQK
jgi:hypothetical protein